MTQNIVHARVIEAINDREDLAAIFNDLLTHRRACGDLIGPALYALASCYQVARDGGCDVAQCDASMAPFMAGSLNRMLFELMRNLNADIDAACRQISALLSAVTSARNAGNVWSIPSQPQQVIPVQVVGMPERVTKTELFRDKNGLASGSQHIERDAVTGVTTHG